MFGPVPHVLRYTRAGLDELMVDIATTGYGLTFGLFSGEDGLRA